MFASKCEPVEMLSRVPLATIDTVVSARLGTRLTADVLLQAFDDPGLVSRAALDEPLSHGGIEAGDPGQVHLFAPLVR